RSHAAPHRLLPEGIRSAGFWVVSTADSSRARTHGYGNINPLSIDYACRPRLRSRLTLGGLAWPRNPWSFGGQGSHLPYRYSCLHSHSPTLHNRSLCCFTGEGDAPLPNTHQRGCCRGFGGVLEPRYIIGAQSLDQ